MDTIRVEGGRPLNGVVRIHGGKNAVLPILAAAAAIKAETVIRGVPDIRDVHTALGILRRLGARVSFCEGTVVIDAAGLTGDTVPADLASQMRASVLFLGALTARFGRAEVPLPGGCVLGSRPLDQHLAGLAALGVRTAETDGGIVSRGPVRGGTVFLRCPSVGATENLMLAALGADGPVRLLGAAREPEIEDLAGFLRACGARVDGAGTGCIEIRSRPLHGAVYAVMPDRMEAATYMAAAACTGGQLLLRGLRPSQLTAVTACYESAGCRLRIGRETLEFRAPRRLLAIGPVITGPYPAFPTDAQALLTAALLRAEGTTVLQETMFENRFRHVPALRALGARIRVAGSFAAVSGVASLHGAPMEATDLRGGAAMLAAALGAEGESVLRNAGLLARGYEDLTGTLRRLGAAVTTEEETDYGTGTTEPAGSRRPEQPAAAADVPACPGTPAAARQGRPEPLRDAAGPAPQR